MTALGARSGSSGSRAVVSQDFGPSSLDRRLPARSCRSAARNACPTAVVRDHGAAYLGPVDPEQVRPQGAPTDIPPFNYTGRASSSGTEYEKMRHTVWRALARGTVILGFL